MTAPPANAGAPIERERSEGRERLAMVLGAGLLAAVWLAALAGRSLISADEGRYASLSLAMLQSGDWITPRLNGLLYFEKPPLQYWAGTLAMAVFGINEWAARLWPGVCGLATLALLGLTARRLWGERTGWHALWVGGSTTWIVVNSHFLTLDAGLTAALTLVLCAVLLAESPDVGADEQRRWMRLAWLGVALAVLSKGPVGLVIPAAALIARAVWERDVGFWRRLEWAAGSVILLAVAAPWFIAISLRQPEFAHFFFVHEHVERFLTPVHRREGAWWYFVPVLALGMLPWTSGLLAALRTRDRSDRLLVAWAVFVFLFFSASSSKLTSYILPMFPPLVLLIARRLESVTARSLSRHLWVPAVAWAAALAAAPFAAHWSGAQTPAAAISALAWGFALGGALFLAGAAVAWGALRRGRIDAALSVVAVAHLLAILVVLGSHDRFGQLKSSAAIAAALRPVIASDTPVFAVRLYDHTLPFYLRRSVTLVDVQDEFEFGEAQEPERWIPTLDGFAQRWQQLPRAAAYLTRETLAELRARGLATQIVFEDPRRVVIVKP